MQVLMAKSTNLEVPQLPYTEQQKTKQVAAKYKQILKICSVPVGPCKCTSKTQMHIKLFSGCCNSKLTLFSEHSIFSDPSHSCLCLYQVVPASYKSQRQRTTYSSLLKHAKDTRHCRIYIIASFCDGEHATGYILSI